METINSKITVVVNIGDVGNVIRGAYYMEGKGIKCIKRSIVEDIPIEGGDVDDKVVTVEYEVDTDYIISHYDAKNVIMQAIEPDNIICANSLYLRLDEFLARVSVFCKMKEFSMYDVGLVQCR